MKRFVPFVFLIVISALIISCSSESKDWPGWRGEDCDAKVVGFKALAEWPASLTKDWSVKVGLADAPPSYVDGKLYLQVQQDTSDVALCLDAENGDEIWRTVLHPSIKMKGGGASHPGPRSQPMVAEGKVLLFGAGGIFSCLDAATGNVLWEDPGYGYPVFYTSASPLVRDGLCVIHLGGHDNGVIVAFEMETGEKKWIIEGEPATYSSPVMMRVAGDEIIILQSEANLLGISLDGKELFKIPTPGERRFYNSSTPVIVATNVIVAGQGIGTKSYQIQKSGRDFSFIESWHNPGLGVSFNTPVLNNGYLYGHEARMGMAYCMNAETGETCWQDTVKHDRFTLSLNLGNEILSLPATGNLLIFKATPESYQELATYKVVEDTPVYAHPVVVGDKLFVKGKENLVCWNLGE